MDTYHTYGKRKTSSSEQSVLLFFVCPGSKGWFATKEFYILGKGFQPKAMNASWEGEATQAKVVFNHYLPPWMADF